MKILPIEANTILSYGLTHTLGQSGYEVTCAMNGSSADHLLLARDFDLGILDLGLPGLDGGDILRRLRARKNPVLILTARDDLHDHIRGFERGVDDYLTQPFELLELEARVKTLLRRSRGGFSNDIVIGKLALDSLNHQVLMDGTPIPLTPREYGVLESLLLTPAGSWAKDCIAQCVSAGSEELGDNPIEVYIHRLRKRLETLGVKIRTIRGLGYLLEKDGRV